MINFHKYGFLDVNKLKRYLDDKHIWLSRFNPVWIFIWKDYYKFEIAYDNEFAYIRFLMPEIGICYYPPLGINNAKIEDGIKKIMADSNELGIDFNMAPLNKDLSLKIDMKLNFKENDRFKSYIYQSEDLCYLNNNKQAKKNLKKFDKTHKNAYYKAIRKEDFPSILEFIEKWHLNQNEIDDVFYYAKLKTVKELFDHMYEFNLFAIELLDENEVYGVIIASVYDNLAYVHLLISSNEVIGAYEKLVSSLAHETLRFARYMNLEEDMDSKVLEERFNSLNPFILEKFYSTFRL